MGRMKIGIIAISLRYFEKVFRNVCWVVLHQYTSNSLNLIGCHGNQKAKFAILF